jgi:hypothetical protein
MLIKRISSPTFVSNKEKISSAMDWPMRPETPIKRAVKLSQDRLPQSLLTGPQNEKDPKGGIQ